MPTPVEELFEDVYKNRFESAISRITKNPELVNAVEPETKPGEGGDFLLKPALAKGNRALIEFILLHPDFNHFFITPKNNYTVLDTLLTTGTLDLEIAKLAIKKPQQLLNHGELSFIRALDQLTIAEKTLADCKPNSKALARTQTRVETLGHVSQFLLTATIQQAKNLPVLRDTIIRYAIAADSDSIFERLDQAGAKPYERLSEECKGQRPVNMLTPQNVKLKAWFKASREKDIASLATNLNAFHNSVQQSKGLEAKQATLVKQHHEDRVKLMDDSLEKEEQFLEQTVAAVR